MNSKKQTQAGFSILELLLSMFMIFVLLAIVSSLFSDSIGIRDRESAKTDALTAAEAALNVISREVSNAGYGLTHNGIITADSNANQIHFRTNVINTDSNTTSPGEDVTYYFEPTTDSIVRYDPNDSPTTSAVINRISSVSFTYLDYYGSNSTPTVNATPSTNTSRVRITVTVQLEEVQGQPANQTVTFTTDVTLRNSNYMLNQY
jgi:type II secretory pathway pseudopilin PulG